MRRSEPPQLKPNSPPTLKDVAKRAGVSMAAASVAINGSRSNTLVSDVTRQRIEQAAAELSYAPNAMARGLTGVRLKSLGIAFHSTPPGEVMTDHYCTSVLRGIIDAAHPPNYNVTIFHRPWRDARQSAAGFRAQGLDGFLIVAPQAGSDMVSGLSALGIPLVVISTSAEVHNVPSVDVDNEKGVRLVIEHLLGLGHRRIAHLYLDGVNASFDSFSRRDSFVRALSEAQIPIPADYLRPITDTGYKSTNQEARHLLSLPEPPTAIFVTNDWLALGVLQAAQALGLRVPDDISVAGFDDNPAVARWAELTTVRQPLVEMSKAAGEMLIALVEGKDVAAKTIWFTPELIARGTTTAVRP